jgi:hypothetical protein
MPIPPPTFIEPREATQRVRDVLQCTENEAVGFLGDKWIEGTLTPRFLDKTPPDEALRNPNLIDWFSGTIVRTFNLQTRATTQVGERPEYKTYTDRYPFRFDRRQLDMIMADAAAQTGTSMSDSAKQKPTATALAPDDIQTSQSDKARLRRRVRAFLEAGSRANTKADWRVLAGQVFGDAATDNLFEEVWRDADLPPAWRFPGRRT